MNPSIWPHHKQAPSFTDEPSSQRTGWTGGSTCYAGFVLTAVAIDSNVIPSLSPRLSCVSTLSCHSYSGLNEIKKGWIRNNLLKKTSTSALYMARVVINKSNQAWIWCVMLITVCFTTWASSCHTDVRQRCKPTVHSYVCWTSLDLTLLITVLQHCFTLFTPKSTYGFMSAMCF